MLGQQPKGVAAWLSISPHHESSTFKLNSDEKLSCCIKLNKMRNEDVLVHTVRETAMRPVYAFQR